MYRGSSDTLTFRFMRAISIRIEDMDMVSTRGQTEASSLGCSTWTKRRAMALSLLQMETNLR